MKRKRKGVSRIKLDRGEKCNALNDQVDNQQGATEEKDLNGKLFHSLDLSKGQHTKTAQNQDNKQTIPLGDY